MRFFNPFRRKKVAEAAPKDDFITRHCFVLSKGAGPFDLSSASEVVRRVFGPGASAEGDEQGIVTVSRGEETIGFLAHMPAPIPGGEVEDNADKNFLWPNGRAEAGAHRSHVIVTNMGSNAQPPIESAITVTRLALVALRLFDGIGVYWGNACVCNSRKLFEEACRGISKDHLPVPVWLRFQLASGSDDGVAMYTLGMQQFGLMDIEVDKSELEVSELFEFISNIATYLIKNGPVIADGNTVGGSEEERIRVYHRPSMIDKRKTVYKIDFSA